MRVVALRDAKSNEIGAVEHVRLPLAVHVRRRQVREVLVLAIAIESRWRSRFEDKSVE